MRQKLLFLLLLILFGINTANATRYYVDAAGTNTNWSDATTWTDACKHLDLVMLNASDGDEIWVKAGIYDPSTFFYPPDQSAYYFSCVLVAGSDLQIYGGFDGTEANLSERTAWNVNQSVITGINNIRWLSLNGTNSTFDGFVIEKNECGLAGIMLGSGKQMLSNLIIRFNRSYAGNDLEALIFCETGTYGYVTLFNVEITNNKVATGATLPVAVIGTLGTTLDLINVTIANNEEEKELALRAHSSEVNILNSIIWYDDQAYPNPIEFLPAVRIWNENSTSVINAANSDIMGSGGSGSNWQLAPDVIDLGDNLDIDPIFVNPSNDMYYSPNFELDCDKGSPLIDKGENSFIPNIFFNDYDLAANARIFPKIVDIGAYECQSYPSPSSMPSKKSSFEENLIVYPTILREEASVLLTFGKDVNAEYINLYSSAGALISRQAITDNNISVSIPSQSGIYLLIVYGTNQQLFTQKVVRY